MTFFENLGLKISKGGQGALQRTKDMAESVALNNEISDHKFTIENLYMEIGEQVMTAAFEKFSTEDILKEIENESESGIAIEISDRKELLRKVLEIKMEEEAIREAQHRIYELRGEQECANCGAPVNKDDLFCSKCGAKIVRITPAAESETAEEMQSEEQAAPETEAAPKENTAPEAAAVPEENAAPETAAVSEENAEQETAAISEEHAAPEATAVPKENAEPEAEKAEEQEMTRTAENNSEAEALNIPETAESDSSSDAFPEIEEAVVTEILGTAEQESEKDVTPEVDKWADFKKKKV